MIRVLVLLTLVGTAAAEPDLRVHHSPPPRHLKMRTAQLPKPVPAAAPAPASVRAVEGAEEPKYVRNVEQHVSARVNVGYVLDGTAVTGQPTRSEVTPVPGHDFATTRAYGFGESYLSTRGVGVDSLSTYFAAHFQLTRRTVVEVDPTQTPVATTAGPPPIATWFEHSGFQPRAVWAEVKDFLPLRKLAPLRLRAGELYVYGPWVLHMYGTVAEWDGKLVRASLYGGSRVPDYTETAPSGENRAGIGGLSVRVDLRQLAHGVPFTISGETLGFTAANANRASGHSQLEVDWRPRRDMALIGQVRAIENELANEHVQFRARYHEVTNLVFDLTHRHASDWRWDPSVVGAPQDDPLQARRYLDLGPVLPQLLVSARGGTLIAENIDVYGRLALASDLTQKAQDKSSYSPSYIEGGGALEFRLRRTVAIGVSTLTRQTQRLDLDAQQIPDIPNQNDPVPTSGAAPSLGERGFTELGLMARMTLGARKFSALAEIYGRRTHYALDYCVTNCGSPDTGLQSTEYRGGGRVTIDAWIGRQVRLFASYDLSSGLPFAPEITGYKSLKLMMEGVY